MPARVGAQKIGGLVAVENPMDKALGLAKAGAPMQATGPVDQGKSVGGALQAGMGGAIGGSVLGPWGMAGGAAVGMASYFLG